MPAGANFSAIQMLSRTGPWPEPALIVIGPPGAGKTHLAAVWGHVTGAADLRAGQADARAALETLEAFDHRGVLDDADAVEDTGWLKLLLDRVADRRGKLVMTARTAPEAWPSARVGDLASRLRALPVVALGLPDEMLLAACLRSVARDHFIALSDFQVRWLAARMDRSYLAVARIVAYISDSLAAGAPAVNRELVREALRHSLEP